MIEYHKVGNTNDIVFSHSLLCKLDPATGGHPKDLIRFVQKQEDGVVEASPSQELGTTIHSWIERPDSFAISELDKPGEKMGKLAETFKDLYFQESWKTNPFFHAYASKDQGIGMSELSKYNDFFISFHGRKPTDDEIKLLLNCIRFARVDSEYNANLKEATFLDKVENEAIPYLRFLNDSKGKIIMSAKDKHVYNNCKESILEHPFAKQLLFDMPGSSEEEFYWEEKYPSTSLILKRKAKIDKSCINDAEREIIIVDAKTTSKPVGAFALGEFSPYQKYRLYRQLYNYVEAIMAKYSRTIHYPNIKLYNVVVQTTEPHTTMVYKTSVPTMYLGKSELQSLKNRALFHLETGNWERTMEEQNNGGYAEI